MPWAARSGTARGSVSAARRWALSVADPARPQRLDRPPSVRFADFTMPRPVCRSDRCACRPTFREVRFSFSFFLTTPAKKPRTECCCQSVAFMIASIVVPLDWRSRPSTVSCLEERADAAVAVLLGRDALAGFPVLGADRLAGDLGGFDFGCGFAGGHMASPSFQRQHHVLPLTRARP